MPEDITTTDVRVGDLPDYITTAILHSLQHYAACLVYLPRERQPLHQCGSGTYVRLRDHFGILTAAHVIRNISDRKEFRLIFPAGEGSIKVSRDSVEFLATPPNCGQDGPDIGFIRLSAHTASTIRSRFSFVNLEKQIRQFEIEKPGLGDGVWVDMGFPEELGWKHRDDARKVSTTQIYGMAGLGAVESAFERGEFDYYDSAVRYSATNSLPSTFRGISGAGFWLVRLNRRSGVFEIRDHFLMGVVYYELASEGQVHTLRSHGRKSIYEYLVPRFILGKNP